VKKRHKKKRSEKSERFFNVLKNVNYIAATCFVNLDFKLPALFWWIMLFLANLSNIAITLGNKASAAVLSSVARNTLTALRVVLC